jgi:hypothetical protein
LFLKWEEQLGGSVRPYLSPTPNRWVAIEITNQYMMGKSVREDHRNMG